MLRLRPGARIILLDDSGDECEVELTTFARGRDRRAAWSRAGRAAPTPGPRVTLYACVLKGEKFAWTLQKATELGAAAIAPVVSERTIAAEGDLTEGKGERWSRIVREAAEQCRARAAAGAGPRPSLGGRRGRGTAAQIAIVPWEAAPAGDLGAVVAAARQASR